MVRPTYAEVNLGALAHNVRSIVELIAPSELCAVVKADGYGHGDVPVASAALEAGASSIAVALVEEGVRLREGGVDAEILVLSEPTPEMADRIGRWDLTPTVYSFEFIEALSALQSNFGVHVKVDTGMHRVGAEPSKVHDLLAAIGESDLDVAALWTHFAVADEDPDFTRLQIDRFDEVVGGLDVPKQHLCNTPGAFHFPEARRDMCRIGLGLYGLHPTPDSQGMVDLKPAMRLVSHVSHVQRRTKGDRVSYGRAKPLDRDSTVVTVPIGYADGFTRALSRHGSALIGGRRFPVAGTVTMDQLLVDVGDEDVSRGDEVVLLGAQGDDEISANEWAEELGSISYEVVCSIGPRVPRRYV